ncbi:MAG TPA: hypothetical protein VIL88_04750 [Devosia sp.]|uniref:hypothetical protein n=1 Tax=Devosia sp. TaxID=1871048 RepID=UPI002F955C3D
MLSAIDSSGTAVPVPAVPVAATVPVVPAAVASSVAPLAALTVVALLAGAAAIAVALSIPIALPLGRGGLSKCERQKEQRDCADCGFHGPT